MSASEPRPVWSTGDIADRLGVGVEQARRIVNRPDFPRPQFSHGLARFWDIADVEAWISEHRPDKANK